MRNINREYLKSTIFGIEDSLVSTTGLIAGLSVGADSKDIVVLGALVAIVIEAVSMGAGEYLSDEAAQEVDKIKRHPDKPTVSGFLMFISYLLAGMIPLIPVLLLDYPSSVWLSVVFAFAGLFALGYLKGSLIRTNRLKGALKILIVGGLATIVGVLVGFMFQV